MRTNRRDFLKTTCATSAVMSLGGSLPEFLRRAAAEQVAGKDTILVVIQLSGGNDGLNTVIPHRNSHYRQQRPTLAVPSSDVLTIDDELGLHPALRGFADLLESGRLAIVQGVGYENPNRSHFESMDIWHSCLRKDGPRHTGWLGRCLDANPVGATQDPPAVHLGGEKQPLALTARDVRVPSIQSLERFRLQDGGDRQIRSLITELAQAPRAESDPLLDFVQSSSTAALSASARVEQAVQGYEPGVSYPDTGLAGKLKTIAQLIDAGLSTRIYYTEIDGFDTHSQQAAAHAILLEQVAGAVHAFVEDVHKHGHGERVVVMAFSEFGRRVAENASEGTDHGAAAPMFLAGESVQAGLVGDHSSLSDLDQGDLKFHTDFRRVYATLVDRWLGWNSEAIVGGTFEPLNLL